MRVRALRAVLLGGTLLALDGPVDPRLAVPLSAVLARPFRAEQPGLRLVHVELRFDDDGSVRQALARVRDPALKQEVEHRLRDELRVPTLAWQELRVGLRAARASVPPPASGTRPGADPEERAGSEPPRRLIAAR